MKTKLIMMLAGLMLALNSWSGNSPSEGSDISYLKTNVQTKVNSEINKWDFSTLEENSSLAYVVFKITETGKIEIEDIISDNEKFKAILKQNFNLLFLDQPNNDTKNTFHVKVKFTRI